MLHPRATSAKTTAATHAPSPRKRHDENDNGEQARGETSAPSDETNKHVAFPGQTKTCEELGTRLFVASTTKAAKNKHDTHEQKRSIPDEKTKTREELRTRGIWAAPPKRRTTKTTHADTNANAAGPVRAPTQAAGRHDTRTRAQQAQRNKR